MIAIVLAALVSALGGSVHCAAMCGPLAAVAAGDPGGRRRALLAYGGGRLAAYVALGVLAGALGAAIDVVGELGSIGRIATPIAGAGVLSWGGWSLARAAGWIRGGAVAGTARPVLYAIRRKRPATRGALVGLATIALPCGWLYAFVIAAAGTASPLGGAAVMAALWLGSLPAITGAGVALRVIGRRLGTRLPIVTAILQIAVGVAVLAARVPILHHHPAPHAAHGAIVPGHPSCH